MSALIWRLGFDVLTIALLVAVLVGLRILMRRTDRLSRRVGRHLCRDTARFRADTAAPDTSTPGLTVSDLLAREAASTGPHRYPESDHEQTRPLRTPPRRDANPQVRRHSTE